MGTRVVPETAVVEALHIELAKFGFSIRPTCYTVIGPEGNEIATVEPTNGGYRIICGDNEDEMLDRAIDFVRSGLDL